jgi:Fe-S-cluster containining protein
MKIPFLLSTYLLYYKIINNFHFVKYHEKLNQIEFTCGNYDKKTKQCLDYHNRPVFCRTHPAIETWFKKPIFIEGCGYTPVNKNLIDFSSSDKLINCEGITDIEREKIKKILENNEANNNEHGNI